MVKLKIPKTKKKVLLKKPKIVIPSNYCERITGRLPYPIECTWVGEMYECCRKCNKKIKYLPWKSGLYATMDKEIKNGTFDPKSYGLE